MDHSEKLKLYGFNNLTKALSFNIYDVCYAKTPREQKDYIAYIDQQYNSERLTRILTSLTDMIGARVLSISQQDYDPQGASVTFLIAEEHMKPALEPDTIVAHLDKSHVTVHTYPEYHPDTCLATFRVDIDVATCGEITPLSTLDYLIGSFDSDIITMDYRVRGFTRDIEGEKAVYGPQYDVHSGLYRPHDARPLRCLRHQRVSGQPVPHPYAAQGDRPSELPVQHRHLRAAAQDPSQDPLRPPP